MTNPSTTTTDASPSAQQHTILIINGPNLNLLGHREPTIYGTTTLAALTTHLHHLTTTTLSHHHLRITTFQSNHEGAILDRLHSTLLSSVDEETNPKISGIIINPGAFTHTSVAIRDALLGVAIPFVEVHLSNVHAREEFRHRSFLSDKAEAVICGLGVFGYVAALEWWGWMLCGWGELGSAGIYAGAGPGADGIVGSGDGGRSRS